MPKFRKKTPRVVVGIEGSIKACRDKLRGILKYSRLYGPWLIHQIEGRSAEQVLNEIRHWGGMGIICESTQDVFKKVMIETQLPTVLLDPMDEVLLPSSPLSQLCSVRCDGHAVGRLAAEHLMQLECRHFAFVGEIHESNWSRSRYSGFAEQLTEDGFECVLYGKLSDKERLDWGIEQKRLSAWLRQLPKPVGILAANDVRGRQVLEACRIADIEIPDEVAVLGVDNDELVCEMTDPPMSSIVTDNEGCGYRAAEMLDALMRGAWRKQRIDSYGPLYVAQRRSTETMMIDDKIVAQAIDFIRLNSSSPITVSNVAGHLDLSRRLLELRFQAVLGRTVRDEIQRARMERVRNLLIGTDLRIAEIAALCGFQNEYYLSTVFKRFFGITMSQYRSDYRFKIASGDR